jgi:ABC-type antimicrobial peptide transport system permease subunit
MSQQEVNTSKSHGTKTIVRDQKESLKHANNLRLRVLIMMSLRNLSFKKLRTSLTIIGVIIGIGAISFLVSLGLGLQNVVTTRVIGSKSVNTIEVTTSKPATIKLNGDTVSKFKKYSNVIDIAKTFSFASSVNYKNSNVDTVIYGSDKSYLDLSGFQIVAGKNVYSDKTSDITVNSTMLTNLGISDPQKAIGQKISITILKDKNLSINFPLTGDFKKELTIHAVIDSGKSSELFASDKLFSSLGFSDYSQIKVVVNDKSHINEVRKQIESQAFTTSSPADTLDQINQVFSLLNLVLIGAGGIGMIIAILGMFNTLTISLLERTKEIGLLISLGARQRDIRRLFIFEAIILSVSGALIGMLMAWALGLGVNTYATSLANSRGVTDTFSLFSIPYWLTLAVILFATIIALLVVAFPARRAAKISPVVALRRE